MCDMKITFSKLVTMSWERIVDSAMIDEASAAVLCYRELPKQGQNDSLHLLLPCLLSCGLRRVRKRPTEGSCVVTEKVLMSFADPPSQLWVTGCLYLLRLRHRLIHSEAFDRGPAYIMQNTLSSTWSLRKTRKRPSPTWFARYTYTLNVLNHGERCGTLSSVIPTNDRPR